eukprot:TRINITY_DN28286_c0_g1_i1.p1 TRINITY_DN28286_c0_g1~~TRINITY_DN28286_c0_g1_i1.p1  ORF type:complete len:1647 (+),score=297.74 TRINITY_DN28286_c0_g1_i1:47-4942(+)
MVVVAGSVDIPAAIGVHGASLTGSSLNQQSRPSPSSLPAKGTAATSDVKGTGERVLSCAGFGDAAVASAGTAVGCGDSTGPPPRHAGSAVLWPMSPPPCTVGRARIAHSLESTEIVGPAIAAAATLHVCPMSTPRTTPEFYHTSRSLPTAVVPRTSDRESLMPTAAGVATGMNADDIGVDQSSPVGCRSGLVGAGALPSTTLPLVSPSYSAGCSGFRDRGGGRGSIAPSAENGLLACATAKEINSEVSSTGVLAPRDLGLGRRADVSLPAGVASCLPARSISSAGPTPAITGSGLVSPPVSSLSRVVSPAVCAADANDDGSLRPRDKDPHKSLSRFAGAGERRPESTLLPSQALSATLLPASISSEASQPFASLGAGSCIDTLGGSWSLPLAGLHTETDVRGAASQLVQEVATRSLFMEELHRECRLQAEREVEPLAREADRLIRSAARARALGSYSEPLTPSTQMPRERFGWQRRLLSNSVSSWRELLSSTRKAAKVSCRHPCEDSLVQSRAERRLEVKPLERKVSRPTEQDNVAHAVHTYPKKRLSFTGTCTSKGACCGGSSAFVDTNGNELSPRDSGQKTSAAAKEPACGSDSSAGTVSSWGCTSLPLPSFLSPASPCYKAAAIARRASGDRSSPASTSSFAWLGGAATSEAGERRQDDGNPFADDAKGESSVMSKTTTTAEAAVQADVELCVTGTKDDSKIDPIDRVASESSTCRKAVGMRVKTRTVSVVTQSNGTVETTSALGGESCRGDDAQAVTASKRDELVESKDREAASSPGHQVESGCASSEAGTLERHSEHNASMTASHKDTDLMVKSKVTAEVSAKEKTEVKDVKIEQDVKAGARAEVEADSEMEAKLRAEAEANAITDAEANAAIAAASAMSTERKSMRFAHLVETVMEADSLAAEVRGLKSSAVYLQRARHAAGRQIRNRAETRSQECHRTFALRHDLGVAASRLEQLRRCSVSGTGTFDGRFDGKSLELVHLQEAVRHHSRAISELDEVVARGKAQRLVFAAVLAAVERLDIHADVTDGGCDTEEKVSIVASKVFAHSHMAENREEHGSTASCVGGGDKRAGGGRNACDVGEKSCGGAVKEAAVAVSPLVDGVHVYQAASAETVSTVVCGVGDDNGTGSPPPFVVRDLVISESSDALGDSADGHEDAAGFVLWSCGGAYEWALNGVRCRSGFVYQRKYPGPFGRFATLGDVVGRLYESVFGQEAEQGKVVGTGFVMAGGKARVEPRTFDLAGSELFVLDEDAVACEAEERLVRLLLAAYPGDTLRVKEAIVLRGFDVDEDEVGDADEDCKSSKIGLEQAVLPVELLRLRAWLRDSTAKGQCAFASSARKETRPPTSPLASVETVAQLKHMVADTGLEGEGPPRELLELLSVVLTASPSVAIEGAAEGLRIALQENGQLPLSWTVTQLTIGERARGLREGVTFGVVDPRKLAALLGKKKEEDLRWAFIKQWVRGWLGPYLEVKRDVFGPGPQERWSNWLGREPLQKFRRQCGRVLVDGMRDLFARAMVLIDVEQEAVTRLMEDYAKALCGEPEVRTRFQQAVVPEAQRPKDVHSLEDAVFLLSYQVLLLNTALHKPSARGYAQSRQDFASQGQAIAGAQQDFCKKMYDLIKAQPLGF